ncbi:DUF4350 domain-containing protein [bacterium SCSIO 12696]|nr:DUF4350 domain-containing protein [bacterium SCSIO 12696]
MKSERRTIIIVVLFLLVAAGLYIYWFLQNHQLVEREYRERPSREVRENPFHAAKLYLERKGYDVEVSNGLNRFQSLPSTDDMIIGERLGGRLPDQRVDDLLDWVHDGGQLLTDVQRSWVGDDPGGNDKLLTKLGVTLWEHDSDEWDEGEMPSFELTHTTLDSGEVIEAEFDFGLSLYDDSDRDTIYVHGEHSNHILVIPRGKGWVMLATDLTFMRNPGWYRNWKGEESKPHINHRDHAFLLNWLAETNHTVWLVRGVDAAPLPALIWQHGRYAVISLGVLLLFWLWWLYNRFGPLRASIIPERRNILEHLRMSAVFAWRQDKAQQLFTETRKDVELLLRRKHPQIATLPVAERSTKLAELCELSAEQINRALHSDWQGEREFIELTDLLQQIRNTL